jgi:hypothetical protein
VQNEVTMLIPEREVATRLLTILAFFAIASTLSGCGSVHALSNQDELPVECLTKPDPGSCHAAQTKFYYDYREDRCKPFVYGGCAGRVPFQTMKDCSRNCVSGH